jgi:CRP-like cAMP-binding protein
MSEKLGISLDELRSIPLMNGLDDAQLRAIEGLFEPVSVKPGDWLFKVDQPARAIWLLVRGEVTLFQADEETHHLHPPCVIGELGALTGLRRNSRAVVGAGAQVYKVTRDKLLGFFEANKEIGLRFEKNLLDICADKINRDQQRLMDMRTNLIRTQKAMKQMRDLILESADTAISEPLHATLEGTIERNRRVNYRVDPPATARATVRMDDASEAPVEQISRTHVSFRPGNAEAPAQSDRFSGVLNMGGPEIPISGVVLRVLDGRVDLELDLLIDEYTAALEGYLTRVQMLDFLV